MRGHVAHLAMDRHRDLGAHPAIHLRELIARGMARDMNEMILIRQNGYPECCKFVLHFVDFKLVAGNDT